MLKKLEQALSKILLFFPCLGYFIYSWQIEESNEIDTMATSYDKLLYNPKFCESLSVDELAAVVIHECVHNMFLHPTAITSKQACNKIKELWTIALEITTNAEVMKIIKSVNCGFSLPGAAFSPLKSGLVPKENIYYYDEDCIDLSATEVYEKLVEKFKDKIVILVPQSGVGEAKQESQSSTKGKGGSQQKDNSGSKEGQGGQTQSDESEGATGDEVTCPVCGAKIPVQGKAQDKCPKCGTKVVRLPKPDTILPSDDKAKVEDAIEKTIAVLEKMKKTIGKTPSGIERFIKRLQKSRVPWSRILLAFLGNIVSGAEEYRWERPNTRHPLAGEILMPGPVEVQLDDIVFVIDTSGSMSNSQLEAIAGELSKVAQLISEVYVITTDAKIHEKIKASSLPDLFKKLKFRGGGGTDFREVFDEIKHCACMIFFTDGCAVYPEKPPRYPVLWVLTKDHESPPFGKVCYVLDL